MAHTFSSEGTSNNSKNRNMREPVSITTVTTKDDFKTKLKDVRMTNLNRIFISHINVDSIRNKFELLAEVVMGNVDILMVTETKLMNLFQQVILLYLVSLHHIVLTELMMEQGYLSILGKISLPNF